MQAVANAQVARLKHLLLETKRIAEDLPEHMAVDVADGPVPTATGDNEASTAAPAARAGVKRDGEGPDAPDLIEAFKRARTMDLSVPQNWST